MSWKNWLYIFLQVLTEPLGPLLYSYSIFKMDSQYLLSNNLTCLKHIALLIESSPDHSLSLSFDEQNIFSQAQHSRMQVADKFIFLGNIRLMDMQNMGRVEIE